MPTATVAEDPCAQTLRLAKPVFTTPVQKLPEGQAFPTFKPVIFRNSTSKVAAVASYLVI